MRALTHADGSQLMSKYAKTLVLTPDQEAIVRTALVYYSASLAKDKAGADPRTAAELDLMREQVRAIRRKLG